MISRRTIAGLLLVTSPLLSRAAGAQEGSGGAWVTGAVDAGAARVRQGGLLRGDAFTLGGSAQVATGSFTASLTTMGSRAQNALDETRWAGVGALSISGWLRPARAMRLELGAEGQAIAPGGVRATRSALGMVRLYREGARGRWGWLGAGGGAADDPESHRHAAIAELGVVQPLGAWRLTAGASVVDTRTGLVEVARPDEWIAETQPLTYVEPTAGARFAWRGLEFGADGGVRLVQRGERPTFPPAAPRRLPWMVLSGGARLLPSVALIASGGRALEDAVRGMPATRFASVGVRVTMGRARPVAAPARELPLTATVLVRDGARVLRVHAPGATRVEVMGTFTGWEPASLARRGDAWELPLAAAAGAHRLVVRVDGGAWRAPVNLPVAGDDFGGTVGLLTVP